MPFNILLIAYLPYYIVSIVHVLYLLRCLDFWIYILCLFFVETQVLLQPLTQSLHFYGIVYWMEVTWIFNTSVACSFDHIGILRLHTKYTYHINMRWRFLWACFYVISFMSRDELIRVSWSVSRMLSKRYSVWNRSWLACLPAVGLCSADTITNYCSRSQSVSLIWRVKLFESGRVAQ